MLRLKTRLATDQNERRLNEDDQGNCNEIGAVAVRLGWCPPGFGIPHLDSTKLPRFSHQFSIIFTIIIFNSIIYQHFFVCNNLGKYFRGWNFPRRWNDPFPSLRYFLQLQIVLHLLALWRCDQDVEVPMMADPTQPLQPYCTLLLNRTKHC